MWQVEVARRNEAQTPIVSESRHVLRRLDKAVVAVIPVTAQTKIKTKRLSLTVRMQLLSPPMKSDEVRRCSKRLRGPAVDLPCRFKIAIACDKLRVNSRMNASRPELAEHRL